MAEHNTSLSGIYQDIEGINDLLASKNMEGLRITPEGLVQLGCDPVRIKGALDEVGLHGQHPTKRERERIVALKLLLKDGYTTLPELEDLLCEGRAAALVDLEGARKALLQMRVKVLERPNRGMSCSCSERARREAIAGILLSTCFSGGKKDSPVWALLDSLTGLKGAAERLVEMEAILKGALDSRGARLSGRAFAGAKAHLAASLFRMCSGSYIPAREFGRGPGGGLARDIVNRLAAAFSLKLYEGEARHLEAALESLHAVRGQGPDLLEEAPGLSDVLPSLPEFIPGPQGGPGVFVPPPPAFPHDAWSLHEILAPGGVILDAECRSPLEAIRLSAGPLVEGGLLDRGALDEIVTGCLLCSRWAVVAPGMAAPSTGMAGDGALLSLVRLKSPVGFGHPAFDPVDVVLLLGAGRPAWRRRGLRTLMRLCRMEGFRKGLRGARSPDEAALVLRACAAGIDPAQGG
jgi:mannitol/fructose-specific phosphotransferase system IIA component (Ntr-type)